MKDLKKISIHPYQLFPKQTLNSITENQVRHGALFQIIWFDTEFGEKTGYADFFPWPEFGDASLDSQLSDFKKGKTSSLLQRTFFLAKKDADTRKRGISFFSAETNIRNHYLITDFAQFSELDLRELKSMGFHTVKIKCGRDFKEEKKNIQKFIQQNQNLKIRLDFNAKANFNDFKDFVTFFSENERKQIEFIEDPMPLDLEIWNEARKFIPIAVDFEIEKINLKKINEINFKPFFDVLVIKPARLDIDSILPFIKKWNIPVCITNSMDHPVGTAHALACAMHFSNSLDFGCLNLNSYKENNFSHEMLIEGPYFKGVYGTGIGFDSIFKKVAWNPLQG